MKPFQVLRRTGRIVRTAVVEFFEDDVLTLSGALTFSTLLSFAPLLVLALWASSALGYATQDAILDQLRDLAGYQARLAAQAVLDSARDKPQAGNVAGIFGLLVALLGATTMFSQLQKSLNQIWHAQAAPAHGTLWAWIRNRLLSLTLVGFVASVLVISLAVSAGVGIFLPQEALIRELLNQGISFAVFTTLFACLFRYVPQVPVGWRQALAGGAVTAVLFVIGKIAIGVYLARGGVGSAYGAASSFVVLLVWVYYSSAIFFFGAELLKAAVMQDKDADRSVAPRGGAA